MGTPTCPFTLKPKTAGCSSRTYFRIISPWAGMEGVLVLLGLLPVCLQADGIPGAGARVAADGSRQSFLGKPSPWEGGQAWSCSHGTCQALGRASTSCLPLCRASLQPGNAPTAPSGCTEILRYCGWSGNPAARTELPCALLCPGAEGAGSARERPEGDDTQPITSAKPLPHFQPSLPVTELLLPGLVWIRH